jgi:hypothetical protein
VHTAGKVEGLVTFTVVGVRIAMVGTNVHTAGKVEGLVTFTVVGVRISLVASKGLHERPFPCRRGAIHGHGRVSWTPFRHDGGS